MMVTEFPGQAWREKGLNEGGYLVCKFAFKVRLILATTPSCLNQALSVQRLDDQPPLPVRDLAEAATRDHMDQDDESDAEGDEEADVDADVEGEGEEPEDDA
jgi:E3 ubiquitin-protein ligase UHRF1